MFSVCIKRLQDSGDLAKRVFFLFRFHTRHVYLRGSMDQPQLVGSRGKGWVSGSIRPVIFVG